MNFNNFAYVKQREWKLGAKVRRLEILARPKSGVLTTAVSSAPPAPTVAQTATAIPQGIQFQFNEVTDPNLKGYNIYRSTTNDARTATRIDFMEALSSSDDTFDAKRQYQDIVTGTQYYWVAPVNTGGTEGDRVSMQGATAASSGGASGAITSINSLTSAAQTIVAGTSGTDFAVNSVGSTHTLNLPDASATARGVITTGSQTLAGNKTFTGDTQLAKVGFNGTSAIAKPTVTGAKGGNAALTSLLTQLANYGLITDSTT